MGVWRNVWFSIGEFSKNSLLLGNAMDLMFDRLVTIPSQKMKIIRKVAITDSWDPILEMKFQGENASG